MHICRGVRIKYVGHTYLLSGRAVRTGVRDEKNNLGDDDDIGNNTDYITSKTMKKVDSQEIINLINIFMMKV